MSWIESHQAVGDHPKTLRLAELLFAGIVPADVADLAAIGLLHRLWWWALDYAPDGNLTRYSDVQVARGCRWNGEAILLVGALIDAGFLHGDRTLHDWREYGGKLAERRALDAERKRDTRRMARAETQSAGHPVDVPEGGVRTDTEDIPTDRQDAVPVPAPADNPAFEVFWASYPRKERKTEALKRFIRLSKADQVAAAAAAKHYAGHARAAKTEPEYVALPSTFIGRKRVFEDWKDGPPASARGPAAPPKRPTCTCGLDLTYDDDGVLHCPDCGYAKARNPGTYQSA